MVVKEVMYLRRQVTLVLTANDAIKKKNDVGLCTLDVNVKNRVAVAGYAGFLQLE